MIAEGAEDGGLAVVVDGGFNGVAVGGAEGEGALKEVGADKLAIDNYGLGTGVVGRPGGVGVIDGVGRHGGFSTGCAVEASWS